jgi:hypothetical protein
MRPTHLLLALVLAATAPAAHANPTVKASVPDPGYVEDLAFDGKHVWVVNRGDTSTVQRIDAASAKIPKDTNGSTGNIQMPGNPGPRKPIFDGSAVWVLTLGPTVYKYDLSGNLLTTVDFLGGGYADVGVFDGTFLWASTDTGFLEKIDVATNTVVSSTDIGMQGAVGFDGRYVWVASDWAGLVKFDPATSTVVFRDDTFDGPTGTSGLTFDGQYMWIDSTMGNALVRKIDVDTGAVLATVPVYPGVHASAFDGALLWVACTDSSAVVKIDVKTEQVVDVIELPAGSDLHDITFDGKYMWVSAPGNGGSVYKLLAR